VASDLLWFYQNKLLIFDLSQKHSNIVTMEHLHSRKNGSFLHLPGSKLTLIRQSRIISQHKPLFAEIIKGTLFVWSQIFLPCSPNHGEALTAKLAASLASFF